LRALIIASLEDFNHWAKVLSCLSRPVNC